LRGESENGFSGVGGPKYGTAAEKDENQVNVKHGGVGNPPAFLADEGEKKQDCQTCCKGNKPGNQEFIVQIRKSDSAAYNDAQSDE
jgi:hypothetical protein